MSWIIFAIAAPAFYAASTFIDKFLIQKRIRDPIVLTIIGGIIVFIAGTLIFLVRGIPSFGASQVALLLFAGLMAEIVLIPYYKALSLDDASRVIPLFQVTPIIVLALSYFWLGETLTGSQLAGFVLILTGGFILSVKRFGGGFFKIRKSFWFVMLAAFCYALPAVIFKFVVMSRGFWDTVGYEFFGGALGMLLLFFIYRRRFLLQFRDIGPKTWGLMGVNEVVYFIGNLSRFYATALGPVALVVVFGSLNPFFVFVFGLILSFWFPQILREDIAGRTIVLKLAAIVLMLVGVSLVNY